MRIYDDQQTVAIRGPAGLNRGDIMELWGRAEPRRRKVYATARVHCALCHGPLMGCCLFRSAEGIAVHEDCFQHYLGVVAVKTRRGRRP